MSLQSKYFIIATIVALTPGCAIFQRSDKATHVESESETQGESQIQDTSSELNFNDDQTNTNTSPSIDIAPAPQRVQARPKAAVSIRSTPVSKISEADKLFQQAQKSQDEGAFLEASELWQAFVVKYTGMPGHERAKYNLAFCLFSLGRPEDATEPLKSLIESSRDGKLTNDGRLLLAESFVALGKGDEALALTFDVLPDRDREESVGLKRQSGALGIDPLHTPPSYAQKIRLLTIRGRIYAMLRKPELAFRALDQAQMFLVHGKKHQLSPYDLKFLSANYAWRKLETTALSCQQLNPLPTKLSEKEFLAYADSYYGCAAPAQKLYCTVLASRNEQIRSQAIKTYKGLALSPLEIREHLPPASRELKTDEQRSFYEREMKALIEKTVDEHAKDFKNLDSCNARNVF